MRDPSAPKSLIPTLQQHAQAALRSTRTTDAIAFAIWTIAAVVILSLAFGLLFLTNKTNLASGGAMITGSTTNVLTITLIQAHVGAYSGNVPGRRNHCREYQTL